MRFVCTTICFLMAGSTALAADWPQWLGPNRDASTREKVAPWTQPLKVVWRQSVGEGHSSPVVAHDRVYLHTRGNDATTEELRAFDVVTGKPVWKSSYPRSNFKSLFGNGPRATPVVDRGRIYTFGITGVLACFSVEQGKELWRVDTLKTPDLTPPPLKNLFFGASSSPVVERDSVIVAVGGSQDGNVVAFDKNNGTLRWANGEGSTYSAPIVISQAGKRTVVCLTHAHVAGFCAEEGLYIWRFPFLDKLSESSTTPVVAGDLVIASSITLGTVALKLEKGDVSKIWMNPDLTSYFSTPVAIDKHLYIVTGTKPPAIFIQATLRCIDVKTGKELWNRPKVGKYHASLLRTGDNKLLLLEEHGDLVLVDPDPTQYRELARSHICGNTWAHPAVANGRLYIRDDKELICVELK